MQGEVSTARSRIERGVGRKARSKDATCVGDYAGNARDVAGVPGCGATAQHVFAVLLWWRKKRRS